MGRFMRAVAVVGAVALLAICAAPAPAAKGIKKTGERRVSGRIVSVHHGKKGNGTISIQVTHHKQRKGVAGQARRGLTQTFSVNHGTRVQGRANGQLGLAALHAGEYVTIAAHQHHADLITIQQFNRNKVIRR